MSYPLTEKLNFKPISYGTKLTYSFNILPIKTTMVFSYGTYLTLNLIWKHKCKKNQTITQGNRQIQCNPNQITNDIFYRTRPKNYKICMETQKSPKSSTNLEKEQ